MLTKVLKIYQNVSHNDKEIKRYKKYYNYNYNIFYTFLFLYHYEIHFDKFLELLLAYLLKKKDFYF